MQNYLFSKIALVLSEFRTGVNSSYPLWVPDLFLASQDALEVVLVSESVTLRTELTDVTLVSEDTY